MTDEFSDPYGNGTLVPSDHWGKGCPDDCEVHLGRAFDGSCGCSDERHIEAQTDYLATEDSDEN